MKKINNFSAVCKKLRIPIKLIRKIEKSVQSSGGKVFLVGGSVRDLILSKEITENPDLVVNLNYDVLKNCLKKSKIKFIDVGARFGSMVILLGGRKFDLTATRSDIETDGRWAEIKFTNSLLEDSKRRDFTFNSIYCDINGNIYDPNGGVEDLINKKVKFIGNIQKRIDEDHLRIMRFFRFSLSVSGCFEKHNMSICNKNLKKLKKLSYERRIQELKKIILNPKVDKKEIFEHLKKLIEISLETNVNFNNFINLCKLESVLEEKSFERRLKFLFRSKRVVPKFVYQNSENKLKKRLEKKKFFTSYSNDELNINIYKFEKVHLIDQLMIDFSDNQISKEKFFKFYKKIIDYKKKKFPLNGDDLIKIGFQPGKKLGNTLKKVELNWCENNFKDTKSQCIKFAQRFLP